MLAESCVLREALNRYLMGCGEDGERDRKVEARALLPQPCRGEVDRDLARGQIEAGVTQRRAHAHAALLHRARAEADQVVRGQAERHVDLGAHAERLHAEHAGGCDLREHEAAPKHAACRARS